MSNTNRKYISENAAILNIKKFFSKNPNEDVISIIDACKGWGRKNPENIERHKPWLQNKLTGLKYHDLVSSVYKYEDGRKKLDKIQLTIKGKRVLNRIKEETDNLENPQNTVESTITVSSVLQLVEKLKKDNPSYKIVFNVSLKEESEDNSIV